MSSGTGTAAPLSALDVFGVSAAAKLGATLLTYPLLLVKARLQSAGKHTHADRRYTGTLDAVLRIWQNEGALRRLIPKRNNWRRCMASRDGAHHAAPADIEDAVYVPGACSTSLICFSSRGTSREFNLLSYLPRKVSSHSAGFLGLYEGVDIGIETAQNE